MFALPQRYWQCWWRQSCGAGVVALSRLQRSPSNSLADWVLSPFRDLLIVPIGRYTAQRVHTIDGIDDSLSFLRRSAIVFGKHALPFTYLGFRCAHSLTHLLPIGFKESRHVRFQPTKLGGHLDLANPSPFG